MKRVRYIAALALVLACAVLVGGIGPESGFAAGADSGRQVTIVLAPHLSWADISASGTPELYRLASEGAVANMNARSRNQTPGGPATQQGAMMLSAGSWAVADSATLPSFNASEMLGVEDMRTVYRRLFDVTPRDAEVLFLGLPRAARLNEAIETVQAVPGSLGQAIVDAGGVTAAIGNGDLIDGTGALLRSRRAGVVAADRQGRVTFGDVSQDLIVADSRWAYGMRTDRDAFRLELERVSNLLTEHSGPSLLVLDPGDAERAQAAAADGTDAAAIAQHALAVSTVDEVAGMAADMLPQDGLLIVVGDSVYTAPGKPIGLAPVIAWGSDWHGVMSSSSTQRRGLITNLDVAATAIRFLDGDVPVQMLGNAIAVDGVDNSAEERVADLVRSNSTAVAIDAAKVGVLNIFIAFSTLLFALLAAALGLSSMLPPRVMAAIRAAGPALVLLAVSVPPASLLMFAIGRTPTTAHSAVLWLVAFTAAVWLVSVLAWRIAGSRALAAVCLGTVAILLVDQWVGAPLSFTSFLGYSPLMGARYYGLGNEAAGMLVAAAVVGLGLALDVLPVGHRWAHGAVPLLGVVVIASAAAPMLGANVGVVAWGTMAFALAWALMTGRRITWRILGIAVVVGGLLLVGFAAYDLLTAGDGSQTHLGRALGSAQSGGIGALWTIVIRKAETNLRVLTRTNWSYLLIVVLALLGFMRWRPHGGFAVTLRINPHFSASLAACLVAGVVAFFTEDSGIVIPAVMMLYVGAGTLWLMLRGVHSSDDVVNERIEAAG